MKLVFKIWNILLIIQAILIIGSSVLVLTGVGSIAGTIGSAEAGVGLAITALMLIPGIISAIISFIAAKAGLSQDYRKSAKYGLIIFIISIISLVLSIFLKIDVGQQIVSTLLAGIYVYLAKSV